jgi:hypothetical protein
MCRCSWCKCNEDEHDSYRKCPLLDGEELCDICCDYDSGSIDFAPFINKKTGKNLTDKEIMDICEKCGQSNTSFS